MYTARSDTKPEAIDTTSSAVYNYYRSGITEQEVTDGQTGKSHKEYTYSEEKVPKDQWSVFMAQKQTDETLQELILAQMEA